MTQEKPCTRCHATKPLTEFVRDKRKRDGLHSHCNACRAEYQKMHYASVTGSVQKFTRKKVGAI